MPRGGANSHRPKVMSVRDAQNGARTSLVEGLPAGRIAGAVPVKSTDGRRVSPECASRSFNKTPAFWTPVPISLAEVVALRIADSRAVGPYPGRSLGLGAGWPLGA